MKTKVMKFFGLIATLFATTGLWGADAVARVGDVEYASIQSAVIKSGGEPVVLLADSHEMVYISQAGRYVIDLNGHTWDANNTSAGHYAAILVGCNWDGVNVDVDLTIRDSSEGRTGSINCTSGYVMHTIDIASDNVTVTLESGTILYGTNGASSGIGVNWECYGQNAITNICVNITGGTISTVAKPEMADSGRPIDMYLSNDSVVEISGGTLINGKVPSTGLVRISGDATTCEVTGGTFVGCDPTPYLDEACIVNPYSPAGQLDVMVKPPAAKIGDKEYKTLQAAIDEGDGKTIKLFWDCDEYIDIETPGIYTIDLNGFKIDSKNDPNHKNSAATIMIGDTQDGHYELTIKDTSEAQTGLIDCTSLYVMHTIVLATDEITVNVDGGTIAYGTSNEQSAIGVHWGLYEGSEDIHVNVSGGTFKTRGNFENGGSGCAIDMYLSSDSDVLITGGTFINGKTPSTGFVDFANNTTCVVSGGTFVGCDPTPYLEEGYIVNPRSSAGQIEVMLKPPAAKIDDKEYKTLKAAIEEGVGKTIKLFWDCDEYVDIEVPGSYTIDLNGFKIDSKNDPNHKNSAATIMIGNTQPGSYELTIKDTSEAQTGVIDCTSLYVMHTIILSTDDITVNVEGGTIVYGLSGEQSGIGILWSETGPKNVNVNVSGGTFRTCERYENNGSGCPIDMYLSTESAATITGGTFINPKSPNTGVIRIRKSATGSISGGTFIGCDPSKYTAEGYGAYIDVETPPTWAVETWKAAQVGSTRYPTLADAISIVQSGDTVVLLEDTTEAAVLPEGVSFDTNGKNYDVKANLSAPEGLFIMETAKGVYLSGTPVVKIGTEPYQTLAFAATKAVRGDTMVLLADSTEALVLPAGVKFDPNGYSYDVATLLSAAAGSTLMEVSPGLYIADAPVVLVDNVAYISIVYGLSKTHSGSVVVLQQDSTEAAVLPKHVIFDTNGMNYDVATLLKSANGYTLMRSADGVYVAEKPLVYADETPYPSLESALTLAESGQTVTPLVDLVIDDDFTVPDKNLTIDLNGTIIEVAVTKTLTFGKGTTSFVDLVGCGALLGAFVVPEECELVLNDGTYSLNPKAYIPEGKLAKSNPDGTWTVGVKEVHTNTDVETITTNVTTESGQEIPPEKVELVAQAVEDLKKEVLDSLNQASVSGVNTGIGEVVKASKNNVVKLLQESATEMGLTKDAKDQIVVNIDAFVNGEGSSNGTSNYVELVCAEIYSEVNTESSTITAKPVEIFFKATPWVETVVTNTVGGETTTNVVRAVLTNEDIKKMAEQGSPMTFRLPITAANATTAIVKHISDEPKIYPTETLILPVEEDASGERFVTLIVSHFSGFTMQTITTVNVDTVEEIGILMLDKMTAGEVAFGVPFTKSGVTPEQDVSLGELVVAGKQTGDTCKTWTPGGTDANDHESVVSGDTVAAGKALWYTRGGDSSVPLTLAGFVKTGITTAGAAASSATDRVGMSNFVNPYRVEVDLLKYGRLQAEPNDGDQIVVEGSANRYFYAEGGWKKRVKGNQTVPDKASADSNPLVYGVQKVVDVPTITVPAGKTFWYLSKETVQSVKW